jgi:hypothetical protein
VAEELFPQFLNDAEQYRKAQGYWRGLWQQALDRTGQAATWKTPWLAEDAGDASPIFTAVCPARRLGVRVIQYSPESPDEVDLDYWVDSFGDEKGPDSIRELVISCVLSVRTAPLVDRLLHDWITTGAVHVPPLETNAE